MDPTGLMNSIYEVTINIELGRRGFATKGKAEEGRVSYETGITRALPTFKDAQSTVDPQIIIFVQYTFLSQELRFCDETDTDSIGSLTQAVESFDDAFLALTIVGDGTLYQAVERTYPHNKRYRVCGFPKDSFHIACLAHRTRLQNILRAPGIDRIEKALLKQRFANLATAQNGYIERQKKALRVVALNNGEN